MSTNEKLQLDDGEFIKHILTDCSDNILASRERYWKMLNYHLIAIAAVYVAFKTYIGGGSTRSCIFLILILVILLSWAWNAWMHQDFVAVFRRRLRYVYKNHVSDLARDIMNVGESRDWQAEGAKPSYLHDRPQLLSGFLAIFIGASVVSLDIMFPTSVPTLINP